jgi:NAD(P)-dependent dehydrogenase (short-subunit alcohol dehydrogenase family)
MAGRLEGRAAVVTGAGRGLGRAVAEAYGAEGATVVVSDLDAGAAEEVAAGIPGASAMACDVRADADVEALIQHAVSAHGGLNVLVANAGVGTPQALLEMSLEDWRAVTSVNLDGAFLSIRHAAPAIIAAGGGAIVTMCSITALAGSPMLAHYAAAKAGLLSRTKTAAIELRDQGVRVNALLPGFIATEMVTASKEEFERLLGLPAGGFDELIVHKQGRYGTAEEVARLAVFLASERSRFSTATGFVVDGGARASLL